MPEGHTIHRAARLQTEMLAGRTLSVDSPQGRFTHEAALLDGRTLLAIEAYGKHLFYVFERDLYVHVHLGLYGGFRTGTGTPPEPRGAVRMRLIGDEHWVSLSGPTACEIIDAPARRKILQRLGPDPLRDDARPAKAIARIATSGVAIGALLMDQSVLAGIGNVYRAELLYRARLDPYLPGKMVDARRIRALWRDARVLLRDGESRGRIITTRPADRPHPRGAARPGERYYAYHRAGRPCLVCGTAIESRLLAARRLYWCPVCQR